MSLMRIGDLFNLEKGSLQSSKNVEGEYDFITAAEEWKTNNEYSHECEALIFAAAASGSLGRTHYVHGKFITSDLCYILTPKNEEKYPIDLKFYHFVFNSLKEEIVKNTKTGTSKESINQTNLKNYEIPYFGIEQQHLWINKLINTKSIKETLENKILNQQNLLTKFKQAILQEAIEGKLTANWREDNQNIEPASVLLEKIRIEKEQLIKEKKIKKSESLTKNNNKEIAFELPSNWNWVQLPNIVLFINGDRSKSYPSGSDIKTDGVFFINSKTIKNNTINLNSEHMQYISEEKFQSLKSGHLKSNDILMVLRGATRGKVGLFSGNTGFINAQLLIIRRLSSKINLNYLISYFNSTLFKSEIDNIETGSAQPHFSATNLANISIPFPPIEEQKEIVNKIEKLFSICDELEEQINSSKQNTQSLIQAILKEAFEN